MLTRCASCRTSISGRPIRASRYRTTWYVSAPQIPSASQGSCTAGSFAHGQAWQRRGPVRSIVGTLSPAARGRRGTDLLAHAASLLANADAPAAVLQALVLSRFSLLCRNPGEASEGSRPETRYAAWYRALWRADMRKSSTTPRDPSSSRFRPVRGRIAWRRCCAAARSERAGC